MIRLLLGLLIGAVVLAACSGQTTPAPQGDPPLLSGFEALPKQVVTLALTPLPTPVLAAAGETVNVAVATATSGPPRPTPTLTPYVGIFLGQPTSESGEPAPTFVPLAIAAAGVASGSVAGEDGAAPGDGGGSCTTPAIAPFANAYTSLQARLGCPTDGGRVIGGMAAQVFERGYMLWRSDTQQIYVLASSGQLWQAADSWNESLPSDDPNIAAPPDRLQPVRGFGLLWRADAAIRDALGWGIQSETLYDATWQDFERGAMITAHDGSVHALFPREGQHAGPLAR